MDAVDRLDATLTGLAASGGFRGAVRVELGADVLLDVAYGVDGAGVPLTTGTAFQIASVSKSFAAACVLCLVEQDRLSLDDSLASFLDRAPPQWAGITVRHLLTHTSGLPHWHDLDFDHHRPGSRPELIARFASAPMKFPPGDGWSYSSPGYILLGHILETVEAAPYASVLAGQVLRPLGLEHTSAAQPPNTAPAARGSRGGKPAPSFDLAANIATGDLWSTTGDLARWPRALASFEALSPPTRTALFSPQAEVADAQDGLTDVGYGFGWFSGSRSGQRIVFHPGDQWGFRSLLAWAPDRELVLVMLAADEIELQPLVLPALSGLLRPRGTS